MKQLREDKKRRRMLGNIIFIGELFKEKLLNEKIVHFCINRLLGDINKPEPDDIEGLCKLLTTVGKLIDHPKAKFHMDEYFSRLKELSTNRALESRIRFMIRDIMDLRRSNWVPRRAIEAPTTINAVHKAAEQKEQQKKQQR